MTLMQHKGLWCRRRGTERSRGRTILPSRWIGW